MMWNKRLKFLKFGIDSAEDSLGLEKMTFKIHARKH